MTFRTLRRLFIQEYGKNATSEDYYPCFYARRLVEDDCRVYCLIGENIIQELPRIVLDIFKPRIDYS